MEERLVHIPTSAGAMDAFITHPSEGGPFPPVVIFMDIWGLREELFDIARRIATVGYYCVVPNFYYREGMIRHEYRNHKNQMITLDSLDQEQQEEVLRPLRNLTDPMVVEDTGAILDYADATEAVRVQGPAGCVGYCMGGRHVFRATEHFPQRFKASASLHGTELVTAAVDSPHLAVRKGSGELYCGFGDRDRHTPRATVNALAESLAHAPLKYRFEVHGGADHGYALPDRDVYDKRAANRDWEIIFAMFHRQLRPYWG